MDCSNRKNTKCQPVLGMNLAFSGNSGMSQEKSSEGGRLGQITSSVEGCVKTVGLIINALGDLRKDTDAISFML